jgi:hypothetical protein
VILIYSVQFSSMLGSIRTTVVRHPRVVIIGKRSHLPPFQYFCTFFAALKSG